MRRGLLGRARIIITRGVATQNTFGEDVVTYETVTASWANIRALQGRELEAAQQTWAEARFKIDMPYQRGTAIQREDRITWNSRTLDILDVEDPDQRQRRLIIIAREWVS